MEELGEFGFWLAVGIIIGASIIASAIKDRDKEHEKQATMRALLELKEGGNTTEILAYMREKDAAELKYRRQLAGLDWGKNAGIGGLIGLAVIVLAVVGGLISLTYTSPRREFMTGPGGGEWVTAAPLGDSPLTPVAVMMAIWAGGFVIAALVWWLFGNRKNDAKPDA